ncbi:hypothetical protein HF521_020234 [Silurus meridionalis]|uniref:NIDO domain-containing protein n=1 Tax=Silurus meridionalis TaxID=175797 RepID=A0A8T0BCU0_SILME|nr:hypothetical protein HF521_020234 [Silurus meridionalis]
MVFKNKFITGDKRAHEGNNQSDPDIYAETTTAASPFFDVGSNPIPLYLDDGAYETIQLEQPFKYGENVYSQLYLNMDGYVSFSIPNIADQTSSWIEVPNPQVGKNIIAPLWTDLRVDQGGSWTYEQATNGFLLKEATNAINIMFPSINFSASWVFVSTWENVPLEWTSGVASLQVVLVSDSEGQSYALLNYGTIPSIPSPFWLAGFDVENSDFITIAVDDSSQLSSTSNSNIPGCWAFQVSNLPAGNPVPANFYPFWHGAKVDLNNGSSSQITLQRAFQYFESYMNTIHVNKNGVLSFSEPLHEAILDYLSIMGCQLLLGLVALLFMSNIATGLPTPIPDTTPAPTTSAPDETPAPTTSAPTTSAPTTSAPTISAPGIDVENSDFDTIQVIEFLKLLSTQAWDTS